MKPLVLGGPTAAGKTDLSLAVARAFGAVVVSADAMQVYRGMDIGTGKVSREVRAEVRHYGVDVVGPEQAFDAADFVALADQALESGRPVVVAGGTSLYLRAWQRGLVSTPPVDAGLRVVLEGLAEPYEELVRVDPVLAARLHTNDRVRVLRGLEVFRLTGRRLSELHAEHARAPDRVAARFLWVDREGLEARIDARVHTMIGEGYVEEVRALLAAGVSRDAKPMRSLGYLHLADHLCDGLALDEAIRRTQRDTRQLARKQRNWMRGLGYERISADALDSVLRAAELAFNDQSTSEP